MLLLHCENLLSNAHTGLGLEISQVLASRGCRVIVAGRSSAKGDAAVGAIKQAHPQAQVTFSEVDLSDLSSVKTFAEKTKVKDAV